jgi:hypothetical protein
MFLAHAASEPCNSVFGGTNVVAFAMLSLGWLQSLSSEY